MLRSAGSFGSQRERDWSVIPLGAAPPILEGLSPAQRARFAGLLVHIAEKRERADFAELFDYYAPRVKTYFLRLGADTALAEEITQEVMVCVWNDAAQFDPERGSVASWIFRIARARRSEAVRFPSSLGTDPREPMTVPTGAYALEPRMSGLELEEQVRSALTGLSPAQREAIRLFFYEGKSIEEMARHWGVPAKVVDRLIAATLSRLRASPNP